MRIAKSEKQREEPRNSGLTPAARQDEIITPERDETLLLIDGTFDLGKGTIP